MDVGFQKVIEKMELSHSAIAKTISEFGADINKIKTDVAVMNNEIKRTNNLILDLTTEKRVQNGRVGKLENAQSYMKGAIAVLAVMGVPIMGWCLYKVAELKQ